MIKVHRICLRSALGDVSKLADYDMVKKRLIGSRYQMDFNDGVNFDLDVITSDNMTAATLSSMLQLGKRLKETNATGRREARDREYGRGFRQQPAQDPLQDRRQKVRDAAALRPVRLSLTLSYQEAKGREKVTSFHPFVPSGRHASASRCGLAFQSLRFFGISPLKT